MSYPKLIVFDFHGTLSLASGSEKSPILLGDFETSLKLGEHTLIKLNNLKNALRPYKNGDWYSAMQKSNIDPFIMMPTLKDIILFVDDMRHHRKDVVFSIASMLEDEKFMYDMMRYCFESQGKISPFLQEAIISSHSLNRMMSKGKDDKWPHISVILERMKLSIDKSDIVLIDDSENVVSYMSRNGVCSILVQDYFRLTDWNKGCFVELETESNNDILKLLSSFRK
tara:strand:- start:970 stop:1647 length:678 start_codon:yes stop_codon:yes gene_type:complete